MCKDPFGRRIDTSEGDCALGRCVVVLTGGRSGGHEAAVLGAVCPLLLFSSQEGSRIQFMSGIVWHFSLSLLLFAPSIISVLVTMHRTFIQKDL